jgi:hypothetical protein
MHVQGSVCILVCTMFPLRAGGSPMVPRVWATVGPCLLPSVVCFFCVKVNLVRVFFRRTAVPGGGRVPCSEVRTPLVGGVVRVCAWPAHAMWVAKAVIRSRVGTVW